MVGVAYVFTCLYIFTELMNRTRLLLDFQVYTSAFINLYSFILTVSLTKNIMIVYINNIIIFQKRVINHALKLDHILMYNIMYTYKLSSHICNYTDHFGFPQLIYQIEISFGVMQNTFCYSRNYNKHVELYIY